MENAAQPVSARVRTPSRDRIEFQKALRSATPRVFVTPALIFACASVFACMVGSGVTPFWPSAAVVVRWGANDGTRVIARHEYWRLITSVFVHGGLLHLAVNMWSLLIIGPLVERLYGNLAFGFLYLAAGIGGAVASIAASPSQVSVGASGAIIGILGALLAFLIAQRRSIPAAVLKLRVHVLGNIVLIGILGTLVPNIDQAAHWGGFAWGFLGGLLLNRPWPVVSRRSIVVRQLVMAVLIAIALMVALAAVVRRGEANLPPLNRVASFRMPTRVADRPWLVISSWLDLSAKPVGIQQEPWL